MFGKTLKISLSDLNKNGNAITNPMIVANTAFLDLFRRNAEYPKIGNIFKAEAKPIKKDRKKNDFEKIIKGMNVQKNTVASVFPMRMQYNVTGLKRAKGSNLWLKRSDKIIIATMARLALICQHRIKNSSESFWKKA